MHLQVTGIPTTYHGIRTFSYLLVSGHEGILIDTGSAPAARSTILPRLKKMTNANRFQLTTVVNTHSHVDHSGGNGLLKSKWDPQVLIHQSEERLVSQRGKALREHFSEHAKHVKVAKSETELYRKESGRSVKIDRKLRHGSPVAVGNSSLKVLHTAGHSKGSISLYDPETKFLFVGDSVQGSGVSANFPTMPIYNDIEQYRKSLLNLRRLNLSRAFLGHPFLPTGHSSPTGKDFRKLIDASIRTTNRLDQMIEEITSRASSRKLDPLSTTRKLIVKLGWSKIDPVPIFALGTVLAHLRGRD